MRRRGKESVNVYPFYSPMFYFFTPGHRILKWNIGQKRVKLQ